MNDDPTALGYSNNNGGCGPWLALAVVGVAAILMISAWTAFDAPNASEAADQVLRHTVTAQAHQLSMARSTETQIASLVLAESSRSTAAAAERTALAAEATLTVQVWSTEQAVIQATQAQQAWETQQANQATQQALQLTQAAEAASTEQARQITATWQGFVIQGTQTREAASLRGTATMESAMRAAQATQVSAAANEAASAAQRTQITNEFMAWWKPLAPALIGIVLALLLGALGWWMWLEWSRTRIISRDHRGAAPVIIQDGRVLLPDRSVGPVIDPNAEAAPLDAQVAITTQEQRVQAYRALPEETARRQAQRFAASSAVPAQQSGYALIGSNDPRLAQLPGAVKDYLDGEWKEAENE